MTVEPRVDWPRDVFAPVKRCVDGSVAAFTGVFGERWVSNAIASLDRQQTEPIRVVFAINGEGEEALQRVLA